VRGDNRGEDGHRVLARVTRGLEWVLAEEIDTALADRRAAGTIRLSPREVRFTVPDASDVDSLPVPRVADDLFLVVARTPDLGRPKDAADRMAAALAGADWGAALDLVRRRRRADRLGPRFDVVVSFAGKRNFNRYRLEDAIGLLLAPRLGLGYTTRTPTRPGQPGPATPPAAVTVRVLLDGVTATAALRLEPRPAHRRDYKLDTGPGTLHPPLAAALARLAGRPDARRVLDPFCGDGTLAIEAALARPGALVLAGDHDPERLGNAAANAARAGVADRVRLLRADAGALPVADARADLVLTNPPWNVAVAATGSLRASLGPFWRDTARLLAPGGQVCVVADDEPDSALDAAEALRRSGLLVGPQIRARLAGRVSRIVLAAADHTPELSPASAGWHAAAVRAGVVGEHDF
jgi:tRNA (guanine6-N2)-methyltransferase